MKNLLIIDSDADVVKDLPYKTTFVNSLADGLNEIKNNPDAIVLGLHLKNGQGIELLKKVIAVAAEIPIIVLSENTDETDAVNAIRVGAHDYICPNDKCSKLYLLCAIERSKPKTTSEKLLKSLNKIDKILNKIGENNV